ncbi:uncharacterized protein [Euphorbia lathyris]|uniref:uncharacterized protein isoform X2 n=1 Tax=Euphorbia lathyris TaxID=212925 RepID=UPI0033144BE6
MSPLPESDTTLTLALPSHSRFSEEIRTKKYYDSKFSAQDYPVFTQVACTKKTARKSTGGKAPRKQLTTKYSPPTTFDYVFNNIYEYIDHIFSIMELLQGPK